MIMAHEEILDKQKLLDKVLKILALSLSENTSGNIRLVGHSLGNQLATNLAYMCHLNNISIERLALLDPAWTAYEKAYLGDNDGNERSDWTGERCREMIFHLMNESENSIAVEIYHTTGMNLGIPIVDDNAPLTDAACDVNMAPWYYNLLQIQKKHVSIRHSYFWSFESDPPLEYEHTGWDRIPTGKVGPSANTPTGRILEMMGEKYEWTQIDGKYSPDPSDDLFEVKPKVSGLFGSLPDFF